jgi:hypothetical protein
VSLLIGKQHLSGFDWRRETTYWFTAAMEVAWFTPWYLALIPATSRLPPGRTAVGLFLMMLIPAYGARALVRLRLRPGLHWAALVALLALTCLLAVRFLLYAGGPYGGLDWLDEALTDVLDIYQFIPDWFVILVSTLFLWWRGIGLAARRPSVQATLFDFYVGVISFVGFVLIVNIVTGEDPAPFIPVFFFFSLMALAATRMAEMRGRRGAVRSSFGLSWLFAIALAASFVLFFGILLAAAVGKYLLGPDCAGLARCGRLALGFLALLRRRGRRSSVG